MLWTHYSVRDQSLLVYFVHKIDGEVSMFETAHWSCLRVSEDVPDRGAGSSIGDKQAAAKQMGGTNANQTDPFSDRLL